MKTTEIDGTTRVCGLIGSPVEHTLSPLIHNMLARRLSHNLVYVPFLTRGGPEEVRRAVEGAYALNILGLNVTVPHKQTVTACLTRTDALAEKIGAVNTLVRAEGGYQGYNTDMSGLYRAMESDGIRLRDREVLVLGAGGAARAVAFMCVYYGAAKVWMLNRTLKKAELAAEEINASFGRRCIEPMALSDYRSLPGEGYLAVQATSAGLYPDVLGAPVTEPDFYRLVDTGVDLIYRPFETRFMRLVRQAGGRAVNGLKMLLYQGIDAYELWNGVKVLEDTAQEIYLRMKEELEKNE